MTWFERLGRGGARASGRQAKALVTARRSGPRGETPWWHDRDQAFAERDHLEPRDFGRGWLPTPMLNNGELLEPLGGDAASAEVSEARRARGLTALNDGVAWRRREGNVLAVLRVEVYADEGPGRGDLAHRAAWAARAEASLDATWRERWTDRGATPGWIEARWVAPADRPEPIHVFDSSMAAPGPAADIDWLRVEDHTGDRTSVAVYEYLTVWAGRSQGTLTIRHEHTLNLDAEAARASTGLHASLLGLDA